MDERALGTLFYACSDEIRDITFAEAIHRIMVIAKDKIRQLGEFSEDAVRKIIDAVMNATGHVIEFSTGQTQNSIVLTAC